MAVNGKQIGTLAPQNQSDAVVRLGSHGYFWDGQILFDASNLRRAPIPSPSRARAPPWNGTTCAWRPNRAVLIQPRPYFFITVSGFRLRLGSAHRRWNDHCLS